MYPDGSISIMDRSKDIIISGGEVRMARCPVWGSGIETSHLFQNASSLAIEQGNDDSSLFSLFLTTKSLSQNLPVTHTFSRCQWSPVHIRNGVSGQWRSSNSIRSMPNNGSIAIVNSNEI
jgi:hypothetical protein